MATSIDHMDVEIQAPVDAMDVEGNYFVYEHLDPHGAWTETLGLPEELMVLIMLLLKPKERVVSSFVSTTWRRLVKETWKLPYGEVTPTLGFHALMTGKILRQCIPHVTWNIPHIGSLPTNVEVYSPPFEEDHSGPLATVPLTTTWRLKLKRLPPNTAPEQPDLILSAELMRASSGLGDGGIRVYHYARIDNPASYSWAEFHTGQSTVEVPQFPKCGSSIQLLSSDVLHLTNTNRGFLIPPNFDSVNIRVMLARGDVEHVAVFTEDDCTVNNRPDLFLPTPKTVILHMPTGWLTGSQADAQRRLKLALRHARPHWDVTYKEFWRVIMRRNHSFRPVSKELRSYESPFYAVYALDVPAVDAEKVCLFFKVFDGTSLRYLAKRFAGPLQTLRSVLNDFDLNTHVLFEEVHSRRLDRLEAVDTMMGSMEIGSGDLLIICPRALEQELFAHYKSLVYTSTLVKIQPNMWHT